MHQTEEFGSQEKRKISPLILIVGSILAISAVFLLVPSSRGSKAIKAKKKLAEVFAGPADLSYLYAATSVTSNNLVKSINKKDEARINVFAPKPTDAVPSDFFNDMRPYRYTGQAESSTAYCILAPDPASTGWTLFSEVWIAEILQKKNPQVVNSLSYGVSSENAAVMTQLKTFWAKTPASVKAQADTIIAQNREVVKSIPGLRHYYQDGLGKNYQVSSKNSIWEFDQAIREANPTRQSPD
jgi:hypothetical protein